MATTIPISSRTLQNGVNQLPDANVPAGTTGATLVIDGSNWNPAMTLLVSAVVVDGSGNQFAAFTNGVGPGSLGNNKQGVPLTQIDMSFGWSQPVGSGYKIQSSYTLTNGPLAVPGGSLTILP